VSVCPRINPQVSNNKYYQKAYAAVSKNYNIWRRSSSGGAFSEICKAWDDENTLYAGAAWEGLNVKHICVYGIDNIQPLCRSKYVASNMGETYRLIKEHVTKGHKALFSGTPCQVAGLRAYLGKDYENLLFIDVICHGVGSPSVFKDCVKVLEQQYGIVIKEYGFRYKGLTYYQDHIEQIITDDGKQLLIENDPYIQLFQSQNCLRSSCGKNCIYRNRNRQGDITIGDFKHLVDVFPELIGEKKNYSTIVINTAKGESILGSLQSSMKLLRCSIGDIVKYNPLFSRHTYFARERDAFFADYQKNPIETIRKYTKEANRYQQSITGKIYCILPRKIRAFLKKRIGTYDKKK